MLAALTSPAPGSTLTGSSATFKWTAGGGVSQYELRVGTTGAGSQDRLLGLHHRAHLRRGEQHPHHRRHALCAPLLGDQRRLAVHDYTCTEYITPVQAVLTSPTPGRTLGASATFEWTVGTSVTEYQIRIGTISAGSSNLFSLTTTALSTGAVNNIPTTGGTVYVRLYSLIAGAWQYTDYTYTEQ